MGSVSGGNGRHPEQHPSQKPDREERVAFLSDGSVGVFIREDGGGWYLWRSVSLDGNPWLAEPAEPGTHHPTNNAWRRIPEES